MRFGAAIRLVGSALLVGLAFQGQAIGDASQPKVATARASAFPEIVELTRPELTQFGSEREFMSYLRRFKRIESAHETSGLSARRNQ